MISIVPDDDGDGDDDDVAGELVRAVVPLRIRVLPPVEARLLSEELPGDVEGGLM